ncbi:MAG TPA: DUF1295 domain-containing protein [Pirellulales bacterium]|jgi:steroid 5-alpha reductase family enzyme|nr:DUF1295 domain-containing protein [Pirellulales bacterium]
MNPWLLIFCGWLLLAVLMGLFWWSQRKTGNTGIVDFGWTMGVTAIGVGFALLSDDGWPLRRLLIATLLGLWGVRLAGHVLGRLRGGPPDGRYERLRDRWQSHLQTKLFWLFQAQAAAALVFALPLLIAGRNAAPLNGWDLLGIAIWLVAIGGEWLADAQLARAAAISNGVGRSAAPVCGRSRAIPTIFLSVSTGGATCASPRIAPGLGRP